jgi:hypothetical protein
VTTPPDQRVEIAVPEDLLPGVYADLVGVWHTPDAFVLDFSTTTEPARVQAAGPLDVEAIGGLAGGPAADAVLVRRAQVVARVRIPPSQVFEVMKVLEQQLSAWERENGAEGQAQDAPEQE